MPDLRQQRQVAQLPARSPGGQEIADADARLGGHQQCVHQLERGGRRHGHGVEQIDAATGGGGGREGVARPVLGPDQRVQGGALRHGVVEPAGQLHGPLRERSRLGRGHRGLGFLGEERVAQCATLGQGHRGLSSRVVAGQLARSGQQCGRLVGRRQPSEDAGHPEVGRGRRGQVPSHGRGVPGLVGDVGSRLPEAVGVVATHAAAGHVRRKPQGGSGGSRVVGEDGRLLVPPLSLTRQVAGEGQLRQGQGQGVRLRAVLRAIRGPAQGRPDVVGHRVEPRPPVTGERRRVLGQLAGGGRAPAQMVRSAGIELTGLGELLGPVLADGLRCPVPGGAG